MVRSTSLDGEGRHAPSFSLLVTDHERPTTSRPLPYAASCGIEGATVVWAVAALIVGVVAFGLAFRGAPTVRGCLPLILLTVVLFFVMPGNIALGAIILGALAGWPVGWVWRRVSGRDLTSDKQGTPPSSTRR